MKREYRKPVVVFESFTLSTSIAGNCQVKTWTPAENLCAYTYVDEFLGTVNLFTKDVGACTTKEADEEYNGFCYHVFTGNTLFNS